MLIQRVDDDAGRMRDWQAYVDAQAGATAYHALAWRRVFEEGVGVPSWHLLAREDEDGPVRGALAVYRVGTPWAPRLVAVPFRDRGGVLWDSPDAFDALVRHAQAIARDAGARGLHLKSLLPYPAKEAAALGLRETRHWVRSTIDLQGLDQAALWRRIGDKNRNMVRQARRNGLRLETLDAGDAGIAAWHGLHLATQKRLGIPPFPRRFFAAMARALAPDGGLVIEAVRHGDRLCAATVLLLHRDTAIYAYSASTDQGQHLRANDLMLYEVMARQVDAGRRCFDLGSDSPLQASLLFFKRKWGAVQAPVPHYTWGRFETADSSDTRYRLARSALSRLPTPLLAALGGRIVRYFG